MTNLPAQTLWETSRLRLLLTWWRASRTHWMLRAAARFGARTLAGSWLGRLWQTDWSAGGVVQQSWTWQAAGRIGGWAARAAAAAAPLATRLYSTSWFVRTGRLAAQRLAPVCRTSLCCEALTGWAAAVEPAPSEVEIRPGSPLLFVLGLVLGLVPLLPSAGGGPVSPTSLLVIGVWGVAGLRLVQKLLQREFTARVPPGTVPLMAVLVMAGMATLQSADRSSSVESLIVWTTAVLLFVLVAEMAGRTQDAALLLGPVMAGACIMAVWSVYQWVHPPLVEEAWVDPAMGELNRPFAGMDNPNYLAEYIVLYLPVTFALWLQAPRRRLAMLVPLGAMAMALLLTNSRGGWLALGVAAAVFVQFRFPRWMPLFLLGGAASLVALDALVPQLLLGDRLLSVFTVAGNSSNQYRFNIWLGVAALLKQDWLPGAGLGSGAFVARYQQFMLSGAGAVHAHNTFLQVFAEMGLFGLLAVLWSLVAVLRRPWRHMGARENSPLLAAVPAALVGLLFQGMVSEYIWYNPKLLLAFWGVAGLGVGLARRLTLVSRSHRPGSAPAASPPAAPRRPGPARGAPPRRPAVRPRRRST